MSVTSSLDHVFLTRFNVPTPGAEQFVRAQEDWLKQRAVLFETYCLPSIANQNVRDFTWIIYFDPESPDWLTKRIDRWSADGVFRPIFRSSVSRSELLADIRSTVAHQAPRLLTTNLDNDDGLAADFSSQLQSAAAGQTTRTALYLSDGLIVSADRLYRRTEKDNAFCSVVESWDDPVTCWVDAHNSLARTMPTLSIRGAPAWLQVVHGGNVSNRVHGHLVSPAPFARAFPGLLATLPRPSSGTLARETLLAGPSRALVSVARTTARKVIIRLAGRDGLNRLKTALAARTSTRREAS